MRPPGSSRCLWPQISSSDTQWGKSGSPRLRRADPGPALAAAHSSKCRIRLGNRSEVSPQKQPLPQQPIHHASFPRPYARPRQHVLRLALRETPRRLSGDPRAAARRRAPTGGHYSSSTNVLLMICHGATTQLDFRARPRSSSAVKSRESREVWTTLHTGMDPQPGRNASGQFITSLTSRL
ncbi:hypothetical protein EYF80_064442 [Liparis tanakae]|uniref:Uncharacterized protein n=1 Tax=Liparis tanakae TaxID=230148 RepID=A0A4Z2E9A8_9TELE|nr:hypothetical protein EYF80_064442 [Liparis tanakae]